MNELKEQLEKKAKTRKELVANHKEDYKQFEVELKKAWGAIAIKIANAKFQQKQNEEWVRLSDVFDVLADYKCISTKQLEDKIDEYDDNMKKSSHGWHILSDEEKVRYKFIKELLEDSK